MSANEQTLTNNSEEQNGSTTASTTAEGAASSSESTVDKQHAEKILKAKELYSMGSRNFLVKSFAEAADELSQVCACYEELYGVLSDELGMPYLLYAKCLIALALDENKVIDVPDEEDDDEDEEEEEDEATVTGSTNGNTNDKKLENNHENGVDKNATENAEEKTNNAKSGKKEEESEVTSTDDDKVKEQENGEEKNAAKDAANHNVKGDPQTSRINDGEMPSTSNGDAIPEEDDEETEAASNLQLAWEILELASKIFSRQGENGLPNLAEVHTELGNIEFENNILEAARDDYEKALSIYKNLANNYRRAMAEIHYKIGLTFLMQQQNKEGASSLKEACNLIAGEIDEINANSELSEKDKNNIQDLEETKQEIEAKIIEIEEAQAQNIAEVRAALDSYIKPLSSSGDVDAGSSKSATAASSSLTAEGASSFASSSSSGAITSSSKPTDISHLIKRKKPEEPTSEAEAAVACSPAKRPAV